MTNDQNTPKVDPLANFQTVSLAEAKLLILDVLHTGWVPNLISSPGIGKSAIVRQIAKQCRLQLVDIRLSYMLPEDLNGFPTTMEKNGKKVAAYLPMDIWPIEGTPLPKDENGKEMAGWLVFLDEFNAAPPSVQVAAYKIVLDKMVGTYNLHEKAKIVAAGNMMTDKAAANRMNTAMQSRICHLVIRTDFDCFMKNAARERYDHRVLSFLNFKPEMLYAFDPNHTDITYPAPRTWEMVSDCIKPFKDIPEEKRPLLAGCVGQGASMEFYNFTEVFKNLPTFEQIVQDPTGITLRDEPSVQYASAGMIGAKMTATTSKPCIAFLSRLGADLQVVALRQAIAREPQLFIDPHVESWKKFNSQEWID